MSAAEDLQQTKRERSHTRIVAEASRLMRERGIAGASVDDVMAAAGLTRGGFYAHFQDKVQLAKEALAHAFEGALLNLFGPDMPTDQKAWVEAATARYMSENHVRKPGEGCAATSLAGELARAEPELKEVTREYLERVVTGVQERSGRSRANALVFVATCVGAVTLSRAAGDRAFAAEMIAACRAALRADPKSR